ncbi:ABC transporter substrate-binding protein [Rubrivivax sp. RP6-9]|uniref:ABC transporter substrate-binding protein n=1 Tax=Rubrivivax sp. RP6-9 TaxID=3415750 RepID=UPI003CC5A3E2
MGHSSIGGSSPHFATPGTRRRRYFLRAAAAVVGLPMTLRALASSSPVRVGVDAEFGLEDSTSAQAIELGLRVAIAEVNQAGGVLGGRPLELVTRDNRSMPARAMSNLRDLAGQTDLVAVFGGKFSPVMIEAVPLAQELQLPLLAVWSSADPIVEHAYRPSYVFRLALRDSLAMPKMLDTAATRGLRRAGLFLANTGWGRSNLAAAQRHVGTAGRSTIAGVGWYNWGERTVVDRYRSLVANGAEIVVAVANDDDGALLVREVAQLPASERVPLLFHQGITGGRFVPMCGPALQTLDVSVLQTFSFFDADARQRERFMATARRLGAATGHEHIEAPTGVAHAYDLLHILALAVDQAGSTNRPAVRAALEQVRSHRGLIKHYAPPFTRTRHEALGPRELLIARYRADGALVPDAR